MQCSKLSSLIPNDDNSFSNEYFKNLYQIYYENIANAKLVFKNKPVKVFTELNYEFRHQTFEHLTTKGTNDRLYNMKRCERILWIRDILNMSCSSCEDYAIINDGVSKKGKNKRYIIWCQREDYVIVLEERKNEFFLITAYCVIYSKKRQELQQKLIKQNRQ